MEYAPGWNGETESLFTRVEEMGGDEAAEEVSESLDTTMPENGDRGKQSSRKVWCLLKILGSCTPSHLNKASVTPNAIADGIANVPRAPLGKQISKNVKRQLKMRKQQAHLRSQLAPPFTEEKFKVPISNLKCKKAAGLDNMYPEFIKYCGKISSSG